MSTSRLTESIDFHGRALLLRAERQKVIAGNIANADTPGYAARDFDFKSALAEATGSAPATATAAPAVATTHAGHLGGPAAGGARIDSTALKYRRTEQPSVDANTVDLDRERAQFADNAVRYEAGLRFINGQIRTLMTAINGQ